jgi:hypothetical protein
MTFRLSASNAAVCRILAMGGLVGLSLVACQGGGFPILDPSGSGTPTANPTQAPPASKLSLYVSDAYANDVFAYAPPFGAASKPATLPFTSPQGVGYDGHSTLALTENGRLALYKGPLTSSSKPATSLPLKNGAFPAFDSAGNLYVSSYGNVVYRYAAPITASSVPQTIHVGDSVLGIALDSSGTMYLGNIGSGKLDVLAPPYTGSPLVLQPFDKNESTVGVAVFSGHLFVADYQNSKIGVYALPLTANSKVVGTIPAQTPDGITFDAAGNLYVADFNGHSIDVYAPPYSSVAYRMQSTSFQEPNGIVFAP